MRYAIWLVLSGLLCGFLAFAVSGVSATGAIQVDESAIRLTPHNQQVELYLSVTNPTGQSVEAMVEAEVVTPDNTIRGKTKAHTVLKPGKSLVQLKFDDSWFALNAPDRIQFLLDRVRYCVTPTAKTVTPAQGIVSVSEIMPEAFSLQVRVPEFAPVGGKYLALVEAVHPVTGRIVPWVALDARLTVKNQTGECLKSARAETGAEGTAILKFELPTIDPTDDVTITVTGSKNGWTHTTEQSLEPNREATLLLHTDKPLYQPKQTVHLRALVFNAAKQAAPGVVVQFQVEDPGSETVFEKEATTSRFGVATVDWEIPENQRSGEYAILARFPDNSSLSGMTSTPIKISRYELPTFVVAAETNQPFYLPGESATVTVQAMYLFGQPVKQGQVRVVREVERSWDYERQKWDVTEGEPVTGFTDSQGRFQTVIDLTQVYQELQSDRESIRDATYRAYFTDASTGRTEQGRFVIRVSQTSLQVKIFDWHHPAVAGMPYAFYVLTELAEGKAVPTTVEVVQQAQPASTAEGQPQKPRRAKTLRTNQLGLLKIEIPAKDVAGDELVFDLTIRDQAGHKTQTTHSVELKDKPALMLQGKQTLYHPGEGITATLMTHQHNG
ncbi:MAG TPA: MG2 domain-containing protein, partial [Acidobacteriota bacterium]|nr:MG2 domain-containing protein [Acidobacteriota bacterium]